MFIDFLRRAEAEAAEGNWACAFSECEIHLGGGLTAKGEFGALPLGTFSTGVCPRN